MSASSCPSPRGVRPRHLLAAALLSACVSAEPEPATDSGVFAPRPEAALQEADRPWTDRFRAEAVLVADHIRISGPRGLLEHVAVSQQPEAFDYAVETTKDGLLQTIRRKPEGAGAVVRAQLDGWSLAAMLHMEILERPGDVPVRIVALGEAAFVPADGGGEQRADRLEFDSAPTANPDQARR